MVKCSTKRPCSRRLAALAQCAARAWQAPHVAFSSPAAWGAGQLLAMLQAGVGWGCRAAMSAGLQCAPGCSGAKQRPRCRPWSCRPLAAQPLATQARQSRRRQSPAAAGSSDAQGRRSGCSPHTPHALFPVAYNRATPLHGWILSNNAQQRRSEPAVVCERWSLCNWQVCGGQGSQTRARVPGQK